MPSAKNSASSADERFLKGRTAMEGWDERREVWLAASGALGSLAEEGQSQTEIAWSIFLSSRSPPSANVMVVLPRRYS